MKILANGTETSVVTLSKDKDWKAIYVQASGSPDVELTCEEIVPEGYELTEMIRNYLQSARLP